MRILFWRVYCVNKCSCSLVGVGGPPAWCGASQYVLAALFVKVHCLRAIDAQDDFLLAPCGALLAFLHAELTV